MSVDDEVSAFSVQGGDGGSCVANVRCSNHTQATAYLVGQKAAEKLIAEYGLATSSKL